jgi:MFS transporter, SP family, arabinose:H+ symporter
MTSRLFYWALTSALAGFLFGFDTVVISGAEKTIQKLWNLSDTMHGLAMGSALWGTVVGSLIGGWPTDKFGRKKTLLSLGVLYLISAVWCGIASDVYQLMIARFIGGLAIGISTIAAPLYISEISPPKNRGLLTGMFQFNIVFGILVAFLSNYIIAKGLNVGENAWRWMLAIVAIPSLMYTVMCFGIPESPRWLLTRGQRDEGLRVLKLINPEMPDAALGTLANEIQTASQIQTTSQGFWSSRLKLPILLAFLVAFFNQLSGINAILYFAPRIFGLTGSEDGDMNAVGIGIVNLIFTFVGLWLIDKLGRRTLLYIGSFGYIASLGLCAWAFFNWAPQFKAASSALEVKDAVASVKSAIDTNREQRVKQLTEKKKALEEASRVNGAGTQAVSFGETATNDEIEKTASETLKQASAGSGSGGLLVVLCIFAFIAAHAIGQGAVIWVFISEIFPNQHRASGQALGSFTHWIFAALLTMFFPSMVNAFAPGYVFAFFAFMMVLQLLWVATMVHETKGVPLEQMEQKLGVR